MATASCLGIARENACEGPEGETVRRTTCRALSFFSLASLAPAALAACVSPSVVPDAAVLDDASSVSRSARDAAPNEHTPSGPLRETTAPPVSPSLFALSDGDRAVVSDPDTDRVFVVSVADRSVLTTIDLDRGVEPGRIAEDGSGRIHVVLRRGGGIVTVEPTTWFVTRRPTCAAPRGIAYRAADDAVLVACAEGLLVALPAASGPPITTIRLDDDLRDIVVLGERTLVSRFRSAEVLALDLHGAVVARYRAASAQRPDVLDPRTDPSSGAVATFEPEVAWRLVAANSGAWLLHQRARVTPLPHVGAISYAPPSFDPLADCAFGMVESAVSVIARDQPSGTLPASLPLTTALATDIAVRPASAGLLPVAFPESPSRLVDSRCASIPRETLATPGSAVVYSPVHGVLRASGHPLELSWTSNGELAHLVLADEPGYTEADIGRTVFETVQPSRLACASCHPEGGDDGHVWPQGALALRTQSVRGGILATAPFHWEGDVPSFDALVDEVLVSRMHAAVLHPTRASAFASWVNALEVPPRPALDADAVARGRELFESAEHQCSTCHRGESFSGGDTVDVGTGGLFQVPVLVGVVYRAPYMHSGCATTLRDRFTASAECNGGDRHGHVSDLTQPQIDDLVAYLSSL
jgi:hypothetical protein